jgi:hypothetical protein
MSSWQGLTWLDPAIHSVTVVVVREATGMDARIKSIKSGHDDGWGTQSLVTVRAVPLATRSLMPSISA